ncbi:hypothetical protein [Mycoplasma crocodyli]|uniref:Uncharacterized protein n=1 Tax=Mycoplasma crocodyli (strain ATCC 51981 / MP145) TaxID=512564 RepID=D5E5Q1_MYCCM|nr:hypothetical protein [Mycoplasma crocodyli]ADE19860.1 hypothetical protein MCRO_0468 [Mycoplasma crocodyli MP145]
MSKKIKNTLTYFEIKRWLQKQNDLELLKALISYEYEINNIKDLDDIADYVVKSKFGLLHSHIENYIKSNYPQYMKGDAQW